MKFIHPNTGVCVEWKIQNCTTVAPARPGQCKAEEIVRRVCFSEMAYCVQQILVARNFHNAQLCHMYMRCFQIIP